jgi:hypothetical protein
MTRETAGRFWFAAKAIIVLVLAFLAFLGLAVLVSLTGSLRPILLVAIAAMILGLLWAGAVRLLRRKHPDRRPSFWGAWLKSSAVWGMILLALLAVPVLGAIVFNASQPLAVPKVTLSNGEREVVFQGMIHIGSEPYYQSVVFDLSKAADLDYTLFFEGVQPGTDENLERMNQLLGTKGLNLNQIYDAFAQQCDLHFQNEYFAVFYDDLQENPEQFVKADVSVDDMMAEWDRLLGEHPEWRAQAAPDPEDEVDGDLEGWLDRIENLSPGQRQLSSLACQAYLNATLGRLGGEKPPFKQNVVLEFRNRHLADLILEHPAERVYITYGYDHFRGVFRLMREADPAWKIVDVEWRQAIESARELERELQLED